MNPVCVSCAVEMESQCWERVRTHDDDRQPVAIWSGESSPVQCATARSSSTSDESRWPSPTMSTLRPMARMPSARSGPLFLNRLRTRPCSSTTG